MMLEIRVLPAKRQLVFLRGKQTVSTFYYTTALPQYLDRLYGTHKAQLSSNTRNIMEVSKSETVYRI